MNRGELRAKYGKPVERFAWRKTDAFTAMVCTFCGSGMFPKMPGTCGSLAAAVVAYPLAFLTRALCPSNFGSYGFFPLAALFVFFGAIPFVKKAMRDTGTEDPGWIVIDEVCGLWMALAGISVNSIVEHPWLLALAFALFRFFDILKPLGIHRLERLPGAWGVMADDLLGGVYAGIVLLAFVRFFGL